ncbi:CO(2)-response secreted protease-like [Argentina anserina]|uniref:CO(2)-response secreted protease-like n=1 Tax=Argentina anserina TaxID=57926 RepID=UPI0021764897|nr:CO(2)-response secreted protease-like [Potentilla anserina]
MKAISNFLASAVLFLMIITASADETSNSSRVYIVYMGSAAPNSLTSATASLRTDHAHLLTLLTKRKANALVHIYRHGFSGFAARLSEKEALSMAQKPGVVSVFPDHLLKLHTTHSWDFLKYQLEIDSIPHSISENDDAAGNDIPPDSKGSDTIIGILDTGIWPESESFSDKGMGPIPSRWKGTCMKGPDFTSSSCNRKLIGARFYNSDEVIADNDSPRDFVGHGTHVSSTAAGSVVPGTSYYGLAAGAAKGGSPSSRIALYKVCTSEGCYASAILAAFDDAISDGVDVLSLSLGSSIYQPDLSSDPIAMGAFHAVEQGIIVISSAGNDGPDRGTVANFAPWLMTVAASTIDRNFRSDVILGGNKVIEGVGINFSSLQKVPVYPLIYAASAKTADADESNARNCDERSLDGKMIKGKIVICDTDVPFYTTDDQVEMVESLGAIGVVFTRDDRIGTIADTYGAFPATAISLKDAKDIFSYINSTRNPVATIIPTETVTKYRPAPIVAYFSSRGPSAATNNLLKPDIAAPGVNILAAWTGNDTAVTPAGKEAPKFNVLSGTSMACPHVSGIAASVKSQNPSWSPSAIRSAIMTTATQINNLKTQITTDSSSIATPYDYGAGEVTSTGPLHPGLVYETDTIDYLNYLCYYGFDTSKLTNLARTIPKGFSCPKDSKADYISNINYPSIAISKFNGKESRNISRMVTNVAGDGDIVFLAIVDAPKDLSVKVIPDKLHFSKHNQKLSYQVIFSSTIPLPKEDMFGSLTWSNGQYKVRSPFVVSI